MSTPLISFAIPAYKRPDFLKEALFSISEQTTSVDYEVVICDDGHLSETRDLAKKFTKGNCRYILNSPSLGAVQNWNKCIQESRGTWVMVLHEDDALYPWYIESVIAYLNDSSVAVSTQTVQGEKLLSIDKKVQKAKVWIYHPLYFLKSAMTPFPGVLIRRSVANELGGFKEAWGPLADYEFWYRLSCAGTISSVRIPAAFYRVSKGQWTDASWPRMLREIHLLRLQIAKEQLKNHPKLGKWIARFFSYRTALAYKKRFSEQPTSLVRTLKFKRISFSSLPSGWIWQLVKSLSS
jgi:glycosyltransferase involved in cell wall biosynthesis